MVLGIERATRYVRRKFGAASNGGGATPEEINLDNLNTTNPEKEEIATLQSKEGLNTFLGDIYQRENVVSPAIQETLGRVQGATVAIAMVYDAADQAKKTELETKGVIVNHPFIPNKKTVSTSVLDTAKSQVENFAITEEKVSEWADKVENIAKTAAGATDEQIAKGLEINQQHDGINPDRDATKAIMIAPIYDALDPALGQYGKAIAAVHTATRSGFGDVKFGTADKAERFNADIADNDPVWLRRMVRSAKKIHNDMQHPTPEDMKNVQDGLTQAVKLAAQAETELGEQANLSTITPQIARYAELTTGKYFVLEADAEATASQQGGLFIEDDGEDDNTASATDPMADVQAQLEAAKQVAEDAGDKIKAAFRGKETEDVATLQSKTEFLQAIVNGTGANNIAEQPWKEFYNSDALTFIQAKTEITSTEAEKTVLTAKDNSYSFTVTPTGVTHNDTNNDVSAEEALISANLIKLNAKAQRKGITIGGTDEQKAMYAVAMKLEAPDMKIINQDEIDAIAPEIMQRAQARFDSLLDERRTAEGKPDYKSFEADVANDNTASAPEPTAPKQATGGPTGGTAPA